MGDKTGIQWTDATWNPIVGCSIVSPACTNCYAMAQAARIQRMAAGAGKETHYALTTKEVNGKPVWSGHIFPAPEHIFLKPIAWKRPRRIFVNSMSDLFHDGVDMLTIASVYAVMIVAHHHRGHTFQWLTKRAKRAREVLNNPSFWGMVEAAIGETIDQMSFGVRSVKIAGTMAITLRRKIGKYGPKNPPPGIWAGVTAERQQEWDERTEHLRHTPAAVRFVSIEPMLGEIDMHLIQTSHGFPQHIDSKGKAHDLPHWLHWVICGGESGPDARPLHPARVRSLRDQCATAGVAFFFKQWGEWIAGENDRKEGVASWQNGMPLHGLPRSADRNYVAWDEDGTAHFGDQRKHAYAPVAAFAERVGLRRAGRLLDGREHSEFPA